MIGGALSHLQSLFVQEVAGLEFTVDPRTAAHSFASPREVSSGNRKRWQQTVSQQSAPLSTIRTRYGNSASTPQATGTCKTQQNSLRKGSPYGISVSTPHRRYGHDADAVLANAVSETSMSSICSSQTLMISCVFLSPWSSLLTHLPPSAPSDVLLETHPPPPEIVGA